MCAGPEQGCQCGADWGALHQSPCTSPLYGTWLLATWVGQHLCLSHPSVPALSHAPAELAHGYVFDAAGFASGDNMLELLRDQLLPRVLKTAPLADESATSGVPYPSTFSGSNGLKSARVLESAIQALVPLPEGWECAASSQEVERPRSFFVFPPESWELPRCTLEGASTVAMVELPFSKVAGLLAPCAGALGGALQPVLDVLQNPGSIGIGEGLTLVDSASTILRTHLADLEGSMLADTTADAAAVAAAVAAAAAADGASGSGGTSNAAAAAMVAGASDFDPIEEDTQVSPPSGGDAKQYILLAA